MALTSVSRRFMSCLSRAGTTLPNGNFGILTSLVPEKARSEVFICKLYPEYAPNIFVLVLIFLFSTEICFTPSKTFHSVNHGFV